MGGYDITPAGYAQMCHFLCSLANGKVILALEGGYNLTSISKSMTACLRVLLGEAPPPIFFKPSNKFAIETIRDVLETFSPFWPIFSLNFSLPKRGNFEQNEKLSLKQNRIEKNEKSSEEKKLQLDGASGSASGSGSDGRIPLIEKKEITLKASAADLSPNLVRTAIIYDPLMLRHRNEYEPTHIEKPERLSVTWDRLKSYGLIERCLRLESRRATKNELMMVHDEKYIDFIASSSEMNLEEIEEKISSQFDDVYLNQATFDCALLAAGSVLEAIDSLFRGDCKNAMALVRPPGKFFVLDF